MTSMKANLLAAVAVLAAGTAGAATFDGRFVVEGGGTPVVFDVGGGELLGLVGLRDAEIGDTLNLGVVQNAVTSGNVTGLFAGRSDDFDTDLGEFDEIAGDIGVQTLDRQSGRIFDALFVRFDGGSNLVFGGTATLANTVTQDGNPLETAAVPVPAALPLLAAALGGLGFAARRRKG